jgi:tetratricopeptide (TPR) repeat protein
MSFPEVKQSLEEIGIATPEQLLQTFVMEPGKLSSIREGQLNTDQNPRIEFSAPKSHLANTTPANLAWCIENYHPEQLPLDTSSPEARAVAEKAREVGLLSMKGSLARFNGLEGESLDYLRKARALDPANVEVLYSLTASANTAATELMSQGHLPEAKALLDEALSAGQQPMSTLANLAGCAFKDGDAKSALEYIDKALALAPLVPDLNLQKSLILQALGRNSEAVEWCSKAMALNPQLGRAYLVRADIALSANDHVLALECYGKAAARDQGSLEPGDWLALGMLNLEANNLDAACTVLERATRMDPTNVKAWYNLARARQLSGRTIAAQEALAKARVINPSLVDSWMAQDPAWKR